MNRNRYLSDETKDILDTLDRLRWKYMQEIGEHRASIQKIEAKISALRQLKRDRDTKTRSL